jgi:hypothetical protein
MNPLSLSPRIRHRALQAACAIVISLLLYVAWNQANHNFGQVRPGTVYRSGQMPGSALAQIIRERRIKTVLNLRGPNPSEPWYREELAATLNQGATHIDIAMSSCLWMSRVQLRTLVDTLETAERPLLIHCAWGSERTGLAAAIAELLRPGGALSDARAQFSIQYLFVRMNDGQVMAEHLDQYENWLQKAKLSHTPANFQRWVNEEFHPGKPSREDWPYDPYPLVVVKRPGLEPRALPLASGTPSNRPR